MSNWLRSKSQRYSVLLFHLSEKKHLNQYSLIMKLSPRIKRKLVELKNKRKIVNLPVSQAVF